jgi:hypothetical protein
MFDVLSQNNSDIIKQTKLIKRLDNQLTYRAHVVSPKPEKDFT